MSELKTWSRFSRVINGTKIKFRIQKVSTDKYVEANDCFSKYFLPEEPLSKATGIIKNELAFAEHKDIYNKVLLEDDQHQVDICYADNGSNEKKIAGVSIMHLSKKTDPKFVSTQFQFQTDEMKKVFTLIDAFENVYNVFEEHNIDTCFSGRGLVVIPEYRGLGIAGEFLKARVDSCKEYNVPLTYAWMTAFGTQKAASKLGWETVKELNYEDLGKEAGVTFKDVPTHGKLMLTRVSLNIDN